MSVSWLVVEAFIATITYGKNAMPAKLSLLFAESEDAVAAFGICHLRSKFRNGPIPLWKLLKRLYRQQCTDPRDKIYSVLGLTHPSIRKWLKPDYAKSVSQVFTMAIAADITRAEDLSALLLADHRQKPIIEDLPSWVADLKNIFLRETMRPPEPLKPAAFGFSHDLKILSVVGFAIDSIADANIQGTDVTFQRLIPLHQNKWTWDIDEIVAKLLQEGGIYVPEECNNPRDIHRNVERIVYEVMSSGMITSFPAFKKHTVTYPDESANQYPIPIDKMATRTQQLQHHALRKASSLWWNLKNHRSWNASLKPRRWRDILSTAVEITDGRTLILTSTGHLGLAPIATHAKDCIFVLGGLLELAILRPQTDGTYKFIGVSYVHGFMNNEWEEDLKQGIFRKEIVNIS